MGFFNTRGDVQPSDIFRGLFVLLVLYLSMNFLKRLKLWEWLLIIAVIFLGCIAYELHKAPGRYVVFGEDFPIILNTKTGTWKHADKEEDKEVRKVIEGLGLKYDPKEKFFNERMKEKNQNKNKNKNKNKNE
jgi:hypothetical protein